jgi:hypothetical protein
MPIVLAEPRYEDVTVRGERFVMWVNPPLSLYTGLQSGNVSETLETLGQLIQSHPVVTATGQPAQIGDFDGELVADITKAWGDHMGALPKASPAPSARSHGRMRR